MILFVHQQNRNLNVPTLRTRHHAKERLHNICCEEFRYFVTKNGIRSITLIPKPTIKLQTTSVHLRSSQSKLRKIYLNVIYPPPTWSSKWTISKRFYC